MLLDLSWDKAVDEDEWMTTVQFKGDLEARPTDGEKVLKVKSLHAGFLSFAPRILLKGSSNLQSVTVV